MLLKGKKTDGLTKFGRSLCTNGVSVSLLMDSYTVKKKTKSEDDEAALEERSSVDMKSRCPPQTLKPGERLVSIDPGRRDKRASLARAPLADMRARDGVRQTLYSFDCFLRAEDVAIRCTGLHSTGTAGASSRGRGF